jgi:putative transposase
LPRRCATYRSIRCARAHLGKDDGITARAPIKERFPRFADLLADATDADAFDRLRAAESVGRPLGDDRLLARLERLTARRLRPGKRGPKPKALLSALSP